MRPLWRRLTTSLRRVLGLRPVDHSLDEELDAYLDHDVDARIEAGMTPGEARRTALADFGGLGRVRERVRERRGALWLESLSQDLRYAIRTLAKSPGFSLTVIGSLSVGIAANVAAFAFINALFFRPFPGVSNPDEIVQLRRSESCARSPRCWFPGAYEEYLTLRESVTGLALASSTINPVVATVREPRSLNAAFVSANYFDVLGVRPAAGRTFVIAEEQPASARVVVISHGLWTREFGADRATVGRWIRVADEDLQIVGIAPRSFTGVHRRLANLGSSTGVDLWLPMPALALVVSQPSLDSRGQLNRHSVSVIGRRTAGRESRQIQAELEVAIGRMADTRTQETQPGMVDVADATGATPARAAAVIALIVPIPILVLGLACVNAANVLLARASRRGREIAVRLAIGASRARIVRQLLTESLLLAVAASAAAVTLAWWGLEFADSRLNMPMPIDGRVVAATLLTAAASALAFGLAPALRVSAQPARALGSPHAGADDTPRQSRARAAMVVVQVALSMGLLATGTQLVATLESQFRRAGVPPERLVLASFDLEQLKLSPAESDVFYRRLLDGAVRMPQAAAAGLGPILWSVGRGTTPNISLVGWRATDGPKDGNVYFGGHVTGDLFEATGLRLLEGRGFSHDDQSATPPQVALVNRQFAALLGGQPLGQVVRVAPRRTPYESATDVRVVGVIESAADPGFARDGEAMPAIYVPSALQPEPARTLYIQSRGSAGEVMSAIRTLVAHIDSRVPVSELSTLEQLNERLTPGYWLARAASLLGLLALVLTTVGVYGVISYIVGLRVREFAVRLSLGATPLRILRMVVKETLMLAAIGLPVGCAVALAMSPFVQEERLATAIDVAGLSGSLALAVVAILAASAVPAIRAARVDPITVLKAE